MANDTPRNKDSEELDLERQAAMTKLRNEITQGQAETQKAMAEANKAVTQAQKDQWKGPDITPLAGNVTSDGTFIESRILARKTLDLAFTALSAALIQDNHFNGKGDINLIFYNPADLPIIELYVGLTAQLSVLGQQYAEAIAAAEEILGTIEETLAAAGGGAPEPQPGQKKALESALESAFVGPAMGGLAGLASGPLMAGYAGAAVLRTAADLASLFRVNTDFKNFDLAIDDTALAAGFKKALPDTWKLWHPALFPINTITNGRAANSAFLSILQEVEQQKKTAADLVAKITATQKDLPETTAKQRLNASLEAIAAVDAAFTQLQGMLSAVDSATRTTPLTTVIRAEKLIGLLSGDNTYIVKLAAVSKGSNKVTQRLWSSAVIRHSAGTELNCLIFSRSGEIVFADTQLKYTPFIKSGEIRMSL